MTLRRLVLSLLLAAGAAAAQQGAMEDQIRKQAEEIARLMRESERLLLELTHVDRMVDTQEKIVEEIRKLLPPDEPQGAGGEADRERQRQELEQKQAELAKQLEGMLTGRQQNAAATVAQLEELLKNLPKKQGGGEGQQEPKSGKEEREKRLSDRREEKKQHDREPQSPRKEEDDPTRRPDANRPPDDPQAARLKRVEAWIARLPPEDQERINRNDFSTIPLRYRKLVEEYTTQRAKREAEKETDDR